MKKGFLMNAVAILVLCGLVMTSCGVEIDNRDLGSDNSSRTTIANTRWQLMEVRDHNNNWQPSSLYQDLEIPELSFGADNSYSMRISHYDGWKEVSTVTGTYHVGGGCIELTDNFHTGISFSLKVLYQDATTLEGNLTIYEYAKTEDPTITHTKSVRHYTIRLKRKYSVLFEN